MRLAGRMVGMAAFLSCRNEGREDERKGERGIDRTSVRWKKGEKRIE
jgi:hypothetical protein